MVREGQLVLAHLFPLLMGVWLVLIVAGCLAARRVLRNAESPNGGRASLLAAMTGIPCLISVKPRQEVEADSASTFQKS
jgi:hypothetical protein